MSEAQLPTSHPPPLPGIAERGARVERFMDAAKRAKSVEQWCDATDLLLSNQPCIFYRNLEISAAYSWMYLNRPRLFKWCGMAAFASYHARLLLTPFKLRVDETGALVKPEAPRGSRGRWLGVPFEDLELIRTVNNGIFRDIFWAHAAYMMPSHGMRALRSLLTEPEDRPMLRGFELIDLGRRALRDDPERAEAFIWAGNTLLLWHEQRAIVQPRFSEISPGFARWFSLGSSLTFEADRASHRARYFASFYLDMLLRHPAELVRTRSLPRITRFEHRWRWASSRVVSKFRRLEREASGGIVSQRLERILAESA